MAYPTLPQNAGSSESQLLGRQVDRATNGAVKARSLYAADKKVFDLKHMSLTDAQKATLTAFYATNALNSFEFVWAGDATSYTVIFGSNDFQFQSTGLYWNISIQLVQV